jgi:activating signal cointegrator 1
MSVALSLTQPWATLVVAGAKLVETRSWRTPHRGHLAIHASKGFPRWAKDLCSEEPFLSALIVAGLASERDLPLGALLGSVSLVDCVPTTGIEVADISDQERAFGDYSPNRWAWLLENPERHTPQPCNGALSLWDVEKALALGASRPMTSPQARRAR